MSNEKKENVKRKMNISSFLRANPDMIATNDRAYDDWDYYFRRKRDSAHVYTEEEITRIVEKGSLDEQKNLSRSYFYSNGLYKRTALYYATLLRYSGLLIPNPSFGTNLSKKSVQKRIANAVNYIEKMGLPELLTRCALNAIVDGSYYGVIIECNKNSFTLLDLPSYYCESNFKDAYGNDIIEFNVQYFDTIVSENARKAALKVYPKVISNAYKNYKKTGKNNRVIIPTSIGVCFPFFGGRPLFLDSIVAIERYSKAMDIQEKRDLDEIKKIIVQKIPHNSSTDALVFEPDEAAEMHKGTVEMLKGNENVSVLTTYADVDAIISKTTSDNNASSVESMLKNVYNSSGVSGEVISATGSSSLKSSMEKDVALMMYMANKFSRWVTSIINGLYANTQIDFKYQIYPITEHNKNDFTDEAFKLASSGFSFLMPALGMGVSQRDLVNLKSLEIDMLGLDEKLMPLQSSYTQSGDDDKGGAPKKDDLDKTASTVETEEVKSESVQGGSTNE